MTNKIRFCCFSLVVVIFSLLMLNSCSFVSSEDYDTKTETNAGVNLVVEDQKTSNCISLTSEKLFGGSGLASVQLTATVEPLAVSKVNIDWSIRWADSSITDKVTDYVTVTPNANNSHIATVTCYKAFKQSNIIIRATVNGVHGECLVKFDGKPTDMSVSSSSIGKDTDGNYLISFDGSYEFDFKLDNKYGVAGDKYGNFKVDIEFHGDVFILEEACYDSNNTYIGPGYPDGLPRQPIRSNLYFNSNNVLVSVSTSRLLIRLAPVNLFARAKVEGRAYYSDTAYVLEDNFYDFIEGEDYYMTVKITETVSGYSETFRFNLTSDYVRYVTIDQSVIEF